MKPKIKVAQIGVGYWGPNLLRNLASNPRCELLMCVDLSDDRQNYVKSLYPNIEVSGHVDDVFNNSEIDAVVIATPVKTHYELAMKALKNKKHILVEKPMARTVKEVEEIEFLSEKNELIAMSGHTFLFNPAVKKIKEIISSGDIGEIRYIYSQRLNLGRIRNDVDALWNLAPHDISIIKFWLEDLKPLKVSRNGMDYLQKGIEDVSFLTLNDVKKDTSALLQELNLTDNYFSIRGELIFVNTKKKELVIKIFTSKPKNNNNKSFKLVVEGEISSEILNSFVSLDVVREGRVLRMVRCEVVEKLSSKK